MAHGLNASVKADFPLLNQERRLVYLDSAASSQKPQAVLDAMDHYYEHTPRQRAPGRVPAGRGSHRRLRGRPVEGGPLHRRPVFHRDRVHQERHRGPQPGGSQLRPALPARGPGHPAHGDGAPRQPRPLAHAAGRDGRRAALPPRGRRRHPRPRRPRPPARRGGAGERHRHVQRAGHAQPDPPAGRRRPRGGGGHGRRRLAVRPPPAHRRGRAGLRPARLHRPQDVRAHRHRRAVGQGGAARLACPPSWAGAR